MSETLRFVALALPSFLSLLASGVSLSESLSTTRATSLPLPLSPPFKEVEEEEERRGADLGGGREAALLPNMPPVDLVFVNDGLILSVFAGRAGELEAAPELLVVVAGGVLLPNLGLSGRGLVAFALRSLDSFGMGAGFDESAMEKVSLDCAGGGLYAGRERRELGKAPGMGRAAAKDDSLSEGRNR